MLQDNAFGSKTTQIVKPQACTLKSNDPKVRKRFIKEYEIILNKHDAERRLYAIQEKMTIPLDQESIRELETLLKIRKEGIKYTESHCRKLHMGEVPYSDKFRMASKKIEMWRAIESKKKGAKYSMSKLRRLERTTKIHNGLNLDLPTIKEHIKSAYKEYWAVKKEAKKHRFNYLERKAQDISNDTGTEAGNVYKQLMLRESQRLAARRVKYTLNKLRGGAVTRLEVLDEDNEWK